MTKRLTGKPKLTKETPPGFLNWRDFDPSWLPDGERSTLATELVTYREHLDELLEHEGQVVVIKGKSVLGCYRDRPTALAAALKEYGAVPVLVKQIVELEPVRRPGHLAL